MVRWLRSNDGYAARIRSGPASACCADRCSGGDPKRKISSRQPCSRNSGDSYPIGFHSRLSPLVFSSFVERIRRRCEGVLEHLLGNCLAYAGCGVLVRTV